MFIIRGELSSEFLSETYNTGLKIIDSMVENMKTLHQNHPNEVPKETLFEFCNFLLNHIISLCHHREMNKSFAGLLCLENFLNIIPNELMIENSFKILSLIFVFIQNLTEIIDIDNKKICLVVGERILDNLIPTLAEAKENVKLDKLISIFICNLVTHKRYCNVMALSFLKKLSTMTKIPITKLLLRNDNNEKQYNFPIGKNQIDLSISSLLKDHPNLHISRLLQNILNAIELSNIGGEDDYDKFKNNESIKLKLIFNAMKTLDFLINLEEIPFKMLNEKENMEERILTFEPDFKKIVDMNFSLIKINEKIFKINSDIIINTTMNSGIVNLIIVSIFFYKATQMEEEKRPETNGQPQQPNPNPNTK